MDTGSLVGSLWFWTLAAVLVAAIGYYFMFMRKRRNREADSKVTMGRTPTPGRGDRADKDF